MAEDYLIPVLSSIPCGCQPTPASSRLRMLCHLHAAIESANLPPADAIWVRRVMESNHAVRR